MRGVRIFLTSALSLSVVLAGFAAPAAADPAPTAVNYVALGDSYASGTGAGDYGDSGDCLRSANSYGQLWADQHATEFSFAACSGAETSDVLADQVSVLSADTTLVTVTIGGNDAGFADLMTTCTIGSDSACLSRIDEATTFVRTELGGRLDTTYAEIRDRAPNARVVVLGYPHVFSADWCWWMSDTRRIPLNEAADVAHQVISDRAAAAGFTYVDVRDDFAGHEVCTSDPWILGINWGAIGESYHPDRDGHANAYLPALTGVTG